MGEWSNSSKHLYPQNLDESERPTIPPGSFIRPNNEEAAGTRWTRNRACSRDYSNTEEKRRNVSQHELNHEFTGVHLALNIFTTLNELPKFILLSKKYVCIHTL
jgi:hypothetical protein